MKVGDFVRHQYRYLLSLRRYTTLINEIRLHKEVNVDTSTIAPFATFDLFPENPEDVPWIQKLDQLGILHATALEYTDQELESAVCLTATPICYNNYYPQPEDDFEYQRVTYRKLIPCQSCGANLIQVNDFCIQQAPKVWKPPFQQINWVADELFISSRVRSLLAASSLTGFSFRTVWSQKTKRPLDSVYQIVIEQISPPAFCPEKMEAVGQTVCPECGTRRYTVPQGTPLVLRRDVIEEMDADIWKSSEYFGQGGVWARMILISNRFYGFLVANHLNRQFRFEIPVLE